jgi:hypothetical protein
MKNGKDERRQPARRFYTEVTVGEAPQGWRILLDGRAVKTPERAELVLPTVPLAEAIAEEWRAQGAELHLASMRLTKIANTAIDAVRPNADAVAADIVTYGQRDLICYRAEAPERLAERQRQLWDPMLAWVRDAYGAPLTVTEGVMPVRDRSVRSYRAPRDHHSARIGGACPRPCVGPLVDRGELDRGPCRRGFPDRELGRGRRSRRSAGGTPHRDAGGVDVLPSEPPRVDFHRRNVAARQHPLWMSGPVALLPPK